MTQLTGNTAALTKYIEREVRLEGKVNQSTQRLPSFSVLDVKQVFEVLQPTLSASRQGSVLTIQWENKSTWSDLCVSLYLAQNDHHGGMPY